MLHTKMDRAQAKKTQSGAIKAALWLCFNLNRYLPRGTRIVMQMSRNTHTHENVCDNRKLYMCVESIESFTTRETRTI